MVSFQKKRAYIFRGFVRSFITNGALDLPEYSTTSSHHSTEQQIFSVFKVINGRKNSPSLFSQQA